MIDIVHPVTGLPTQIVQSTNDPDLDTAREFLVVNGKPPCPLCSTPVVDQERVLEGPDVTEYAQRQWVVVPALSHFVMRPCGCAVRADSLKMYSTDEGGLFCIVGEKYGGAR